MKPKHVRMRIDQCLALASLSPCPRRKYGAVAIDPTSNIIISEGYNGSARGASNSLCGGWFCRRNGITRDQIEVVQHLGRFLVQTKERGTDFDGVRVGDNLPTCRFGDSPNEAWAQALVDDVVTNNAPIPSGTRYELGCHHSESNVVCNAARVGRSLLGAWLFCTGMPCMGCARLIAQSGIIKVITIRDGYAGENGADYLRANGVVVEEVDPPTNGPVGPMVDPGGR